MKKISAFSFFISFLLLATSCKFGLNEIFGRDADVDARSSSIKILSDTETSGINKSGNFNFIMFTDVHFGKSGFPDRKEKLLKWLDSVKADSEKNPSFAVCLGDFADKGLDSEYDQFVSFTNDIKSKAGIKTYSIVGNHDLYNSGWKKYKEKVFPYSSFYKFSTDEFSFYFIDSASGQIGNKQFNSLKDSFASDSKLKVVFSHFPLTTEHDFYFRMQNLTERNRLLALMAQNKVVRFFSGHIHKTMETNFGAFTDSSFTSFGKDGQFVLVHVNQTQKTVTYEVIK